MVKWLILVEDPMCDTIAHGPYDTKEAAQADVSRWFDVAFDENAEKMKAQCDLTADYIEVEDKDGDGIHGTIELTLIELAWF